MSGSKIPRALAVNLSPIFKPLTGVILKKLSGTQKYKLIDQAIASFKRTITESAARNLDDYIARQLLKYPACCQPCKWAKTAPKQKPCITCKWDKKKQTGTKYEPMEFILERRSIMER